jgi:hypothetical protein
MHLLSTKGGFVCIFNRSPSQVKRGFGPGAEVGMATWQYVVLLAFLFGIGFELSQIDILLRRILTELQKPK